MKRVSFKLKFLIFVVLVVVISISIPIGKTITRNKRITSEATRFAESFGLKDIKIIIGGKIPGYDFYNVTVDSSNFDSLSYTQMFSLSDSMSFVDDAFISTFTCSGDSYEVFSSTKSIYKNGSEIYDDYWNSQSHKDATKNNNGKSYSSSSSNSSSRSYTPYKRPAENDDYDEYNVKDYKFAEDFYEDHYDDFFDFDDAEDYFNEHND